MTQNWILFKNHETSKTHLFYDTMNSKMDKTELDPFKTQLEGRLKALKKLLEITKNEEANAGGPDQDAFFRKPMIGYQSVAYDAQQFGQVPHASIPTVVCLNSWKAEFSCLKILKLFFLHLFQAENHQKPLKNN